MFNFFRKKKDKKNENVVSRKTRDSNSSSSNHTEDNSLPITFFGIINDTSSHTHNTDYSSYDSSSSYDSGSSYDGGSSGCDSGGCGGGCD